MVAVWFFYSSRSGGGRPEANFDGGPAVTVEYTETAKEKNSATTGELHALMHIKVLVF